MNKLEIINRISIARTNAHLSARALSLEAGLNGGYINRLESKKDFLPSLESFLEILDVCNITPEEFFYHNPECYKEDMKLLNVFKNLPKEKKQLLIELFKN